MIQKFLTITMYVLLCTKGGDFFDTLCFFRGSLIQQRKQLTNTFLIGLEEIKVEIIFAWCKFNKITYMKEMHHCCLCSNEQLILL
jgi:hypothetical protein